MKFYMRLPFIPLILFVLLGINFPASSDDEGVMMPDVPLLEGIVQKYNAGRRTLVVDGVRYHVTDDTEIHAVGRERSSKAKLRPGVRVQLLISPEAKQTPFGVALAAVIILKPAAGSRRPVSDFTDSRDGNHAHAR